MPTEELNIQAMVARCCDEIFSFVDQVPPPVRPRPTVNRPANVQVSGTGDVLTLTQSWFNPVGAFFLLFFCLFWDGFLVVWYALALMQEKLDLVALIFPTFHLLAGVFLTYLCASTFVNRTILTVTRRDVSLRIAPLPWPGKFDVPISEVDQFYTEETRRRKGSNHFALCALMKDGSKKRLVSGLLEENTALFFEQTLENWYGMEDRPVQGEVMRT